MKNLYSAKWISDFKIQAEIKKKIVSNCRLRDIVEIIKKEVAERYTKSASRSISRSARYIYSKSSSTEMSSTVDSEKQNGVVLGRFAVRQAFATDTENYKLKHCWILDSVTDIYICNDFSRFKFEYIANEDDELYSGCTVYSIESYSIVDIIIDISTSPRIMILLDIVLVSNFFTNLVYLCRLTNKNINWNIQNSILQRNGAILYYIYDIEDHWILENKTSSSSAFSVFSVSRLKHTNVGDNAVC